MLENYDSLKDIIFKVCPNKEAKILMIGCGNAGIVIFRAQRAYA